MKKQFFVLVVFVLMLIPAVSFSAFDSADFNKTKVLEVSRITPKGNDVPAGRQIVIQFNQPVVPLGRMERDKKEIPIEITPELKGQWRWLNTSSLAYQLDNKNALQYATRYSVVIKPGIKTEKGDTTKETITHSFITRRPTIRYNSFRTWKSPGTPVIRVTFNQPVFIDSVMKHLFFVSGKISGKRIGAKVEPYTANYNKPVIIDGNEARKNWLVTPLEELSLDTDVTLRVEPGLVSAYGPEKGITKRVLVSFVTFPKFKFLGVRCYTNKDNNQQLIKSETDKIYANPLEYIALEFTSPVIVDEVKDNVTFTPDLAGGRTDYDPWANSYRYSHLRSTHHRNTVYTVRLPELLKAFRKYTIKETPFGLKDEFGRKTSKPIDLTFYTDHRKPHYNLLHDTAVLEKDVNTDASLVVTNIDKMKMRYKALTTEGSSQNLQYIKELDEVKDIAYAVPLGIRQMLSNKTGAIYGTLESDPYVKKYSDENLFFAQVTPYQIHVKAGHFNYVVWVTDLATGKPVDGAEVTIYKDSIAGLKFSNTILGKAVTKDDGVAYLPGNEQINPGLELSGWSYNDDRERLFVKVVKGEDMGVLPIDSRFEIDTWRVSDSEISSNTYRKYGHIHTWGTTAQGLYRAGDVIQYKIYVRNQNNEKFIQPPLKGYSLTIIDPTGKKVAEIKDVTLSEFGAFDGEYKVPENGAVGMYSFELSSKTANTTWVPMTVLVSDFTPSPFRVTNELNQDLFKDGDAVEVSTFARLHAGGPYTEASTRVVARLKERSFYSKDPLVKGFTFSSRDSSSRTDNLFQRTEKLDDKGDLVSKFKIENNHILYGRLMVESAVKDDRGKFVASSSTADYSGRDRFVGLKAEKWLCKEGEPAQFSYVVVDENGKPTAGIKTTVYAEQRVTKVSRVKGAGNAYLTHYSHQWVRVNEFKADSVEKPGMYDFTPAEPGSYRITAEIQDTKGRSHSTMMWTWVVGKGRVLWDTSDDNSLQIIPEEETYNIGETARYLVKNPYPGATALITIERYGVLKHWTQTLEGNTPVIEFPVEADYLPGFYLSVSVMSPRVEKPLGDGNVDLGKPAFKIGYVAVPVKDPYKVINIDIKPEHEVYKPGETVNVALKALVKNPGNKEPIELAVAVLDEAVFDLLSQGKSNFDPYKGFYSVDGLDLINYNLLLKLVGIQKFEKKGANTGGDGGSDISMRSVFKFISYWNPSIKADENGCADIEFKVPDNLTGWRVFVMAVTPTDRMGLGDNGFKVNRPTEVRPVMPNQVTEGDTFKAGFSVMNRTDKNRTLDVSIKATGSVDTETGTAEMKTEIECPPYKRKTIFLPVKTKKFGEVSFTATAKDSMDGDGVKHLVPVGQRRSLETAATYGTTTAKEVSENILVPEKIHDDVGSIGVVLSPAVIGNVEGSFKYMKEYPYSCWEQKMTKAVMASHYINLKAYVSDDFLWRNAKDIILETMKLAESHQAPSGGMAYYTPMDNYVSPYLSAYTALAFTWLTKSGYTVPEKVEKNLQDYLDKLLKQDVLPSFYSKGMSSTVRAVALAALSESGKLSVTDLNRYKEHVAQMSLFGKAHYLTAAIRIKGGEKIAKEVCNMILSHANQTGGKFIFSEDLDLSYARILATPARANAAILSVMTEFGETAAGKELIGDVPFKLVRYITQARGKRDRWENTQENIFCLNALTEYSRVYENVKPDMTVNVFVDKNSIGNTEFKDLRDDAVTIKRPIDKNDPGQKRTLTINKHGDGRVYYSARVSFAPLEEHAVRLNAGIDLRKEISVERDGKWKILESPMTIKRGELVRVDLFMSIPSARNFVVIDDPVPGGLEPVNRDLATASVIDAEKGEFQVAGGSWWLHFSDWFSYSSSRWSFYHKELRHDSVRFYSDWLPAGNYHLSYTAQAIAEGSFVSMPVHAEEMYDPDVFGKGLPRILNVLPAD